MSSSDSSDDLLQGSVTDSSEESDKDEDSEYISAASSGKLEDFYTVGEEIGRGAFSIVRDALSLQTGKKVAVKSIKTKFIKNKLLRREIDIMKKVATHPNILELYGVYESKNHLHLVLEICKGGELFDRIVAKGEYSEKEASKVVKQIVSAVGHLHAHGIAHRDLKPQNLLCDEFDNIRVADFGLSKMFDTGEDLETCCGSPEYVAPEVLECKPYDHMVDLWSCGVITYVLLTGCFPFWDKNHAVLYEKIRNVDYGWPENSDVSAAAKHLVKQLLERDPEKRFTAEKTLKHPWVTGKGVSKLKKLKSFKDLQAVSKKKNWK